MKIERLNEFAKGISWNPVVWHWYYQIRDYGKAQKVYSNIPFTILDPLDDEDMSSEDIDWSEAEDMIGRPIKYDQSAYQDLPLFKEILRQLREQNPNAYLKLVKVSEEIIN